MVTESGCVVISKCRNLQLPFSALTQCHPITGKGRGLQRVVVTCCNILPSKSYSQGSLSWAQCVGMPPSVTCTDMQCVGMLYFVTCIDMQCVGMLYSVTCIDMHSLQCMGMQALPRGLGMQSSRQVKVKIVLQPFSFYWSLGSEVLQTSLLPDTHYCQLGRLGKVCIHTGIEPVLLWVRMPELSPTDNGLAILTHCVRAVLCTD